jgi:hypothetical protein
VEALSRLLSVEASPVADVLRHGLRGLSASVGEALRQAPADPGASAGQAVLEELAELLREPPRTGALLAALRAEVEGSARLQERLGPFRPQAATDAELWNEVQRLLLRLAPPDAQQWSARAAELACEAGARPASWVAHCLLDESSEVVYPGLTGSVEAPGLVLSPRATLHPALGGPFTGDAALFAPDVSFCLYFAEWDGTLHHALEAVRPLGAHALTGAQRERYARELLRRFQQVRKAEGSSLAALHAWIALDEAIHSLVHRPPAERLSWWQQRQQRARQRLDVAAERARRDGHRVHVRWLTGAYRQVKAFSRNDWGLESGGNLGDVLACLRVYAEIDGQAYPGRVIYRDY